MKPEQWEIFKSAARLKYSGPVPMALIIDCPWIPGFLGLSQMQYHLDNETWFRANLDIYRRFPEVTFVPSWWVEYGMAAEPSVLGAKVKFDEATMPGIEHTLQRLEDFTHFRNYQIEKDAFAALTLHRLRLLKPRILAEGEILPLVAARGPLCTACFVRGVTEFMMDIIDEPDTALAFIELCTDVVIDWLKAQQAVIGGSVEGFLLLDDMVGFLNEQQYMEFAHPFLKRICDAFPDDWVKIYHNDANVQACLEHLPDVGFNVLQWGKQIPFSEVRRRTADRMCLMGNVNPLEIGVRGTPDEVRQATLEVLEQSGGRNMVLSLGGGTSPGMPEANIRAMIDALRQFNRS